MNRAEARFPSAAAAMPDLQLRSWDTAHLTADLSQDTEIYLGRAGSWRKSWGVRNIVPDDIQSHIWV